MVVHAHDPGALWLMPIRGAGVRCHCWKQSGGLWRGGSVAREAQTMVMGGREWQKGCPDGGDEAGNGSLPASGCLLAKGI